LKTCNAKRREFEVAAASLAICMAVMVFVNGPTPAAEAEDAAPPNEAPDPEPVLEETIEVLAERPVMDAEQLGDESLDNGRALNLGLAVESIPGVSGVRRAQNSVEPVVRGLGWERVQTQLNGLPLYGACPGRMDPPAFIIPGAFVRQATVVRGLSSVTLGPAGTGGRLMVSTDRRPAPGAAHGPEGWVNLTWAEARDGYSGDAGVAGGTERLDYTAGLDLLDHDDYHSADGTSVPAAQAEQSGYVSFAHRPTETQRWSIDGVFQDADHIDYPSLPMDSDDSKAKLLTASYVFEPSGTGTLSAIEARLGWADIDHRMSNHDKPNRGMLEAEAETTSGTGSAAVNGRWVLSSRSLVKGGVDWTALDRDAVRERRMVASGMTSYDHLWPDVSQDDLGLFAEYSVVPGPGWQVRVGVRWDQVSSAAAAADDPSLGGRTVRENYVLFYGPAAAETDRDEGLFTGNVVASRDIGARLSLQVGAGLVSRAAGMSERYYAFAPAPNGFVVGNPALDAERKRELSLGATLRTGRFSGTLALYHYGFDDYIYPSIIEQRDVNGDGIDDLIRGYTNVEATLWGGEISAVYQPTTRFSLPMSLAYVRGENDDAGAPLPEIPPLEGRLAGRYELGGRYPGWIELGGRFADRQDRIDPAFGENATPGFAVWHLRTAFRFGGRVELQFGVENLFDKQYHEHLTREASMAVGDLQAGDEIPQPGRSVIVSTRVTL